MHNQRPLAASRTVDPRTRRLLHDLDMLETLVSDDRAPARKRLVALLGEEQLQTLLAELARPAAPTSRERMVVGTVIFVRKALHGLREGSGVTKFARLKLWQRSLFFVALSCGAAVSLVGTIDLIWHLRFVLAGLGGIALVLVVFQQTRHRSDENWIGS
jgi:hypothetical protein